MKHRLKTILADKSGSTIIIIPFLVLGVIILGTTMWEYSRLNTVAQGSRDAVQSAITQACTEQYDQLYPGLREGYSGGYKLESTDWTENVDLININSKIDAKLGTSNGTKTSNGKTEYKISNMSVQLHNAPLAPDNPDITQQFIGTATYTLTVPLSFGWSALPPMVVPMKVTAGYSPQGELGAGDGDGSDDDGIPVTGVALNESALTLQKGEYASLSAEVSPDDATDPDVTWVSANDGVATVNRAGLVKGMDAGTTTVLAMSDGRMAECDVTVVNPVTHVALNKTNLKLNKGASETLVATVAPDNATDKSLWWTTSNSDICTIDANGKVTAVSPGTAEISVEARSGGVMATCQVTVESPVSGVSLNKTEMTLRPESSEKLTATVTPEDATNPGVMWASSSPEVCTVDQDGNVTAVRAGTSVISATAKDNVHMAQCTVTVTIPVTGVTLNKTIISIIKETSDILYATVWPADATNKAITWSSSNSAVCSVNQSGVITGTGVGTATITVTTQDGGFTANCVVEVKPNTYVVSANAVHGHVEGTGIYWAGMNVTLTAVPDYNYEFVSWTNSSGAVIGASTTYTIYNLSEDVTVTAHFKERAYRWTYETSSSYCSASDNSNTASLYANYSQNSSRKNGYGQVVYTFKEPVVLPAGSGIAVTIDWGDFFLVGGTVSVNDVQLAKPHNHYSYGSGTSDMYRYPSGITLNTITIRSDYGSREHYDSATIKVKVIPLDGKPFLMNFTGTSENQSWNEKFTCDDDWGSKYDHSVVNPSYINYTANTNYTDGSGYEVDYHYYKPLDIDRIEVTPSAVGDSSFNRGYFSFVLKDVNNNTKRFTSYVKPGSMDAQYACYMSSFTDASGNYVIPVQANLPARGYDTGGTNGNGGGSEYKGAIYVYGSADDSKICSMYFTWGTKCNTRVTIKVYLKDGTSYNING
ncbi:Ig-like domain-containing protein [Caproiciproducens faecalis]|uniref:Ig-like domain-containing protein n=1 Tax=Caproiciproducens faecalis TaxID=2820301 RepID=A0ABS7DPQ1_9FIRM|nr:Ig-like domain-containing protein [Caproiciproducens faecalis]MBW7573173.1 Ig-like domain-containing protein [Caproiciproducens faecalis]